MISATSLNASSSLNKGHQIPLGLDTGRLRVDSQKFLVPSLPVSARGVGSHHSLDPKRRERSIVNGTGHAVPAEYTHSYPSPLNGFSRPGFNNHNHGHNSSAGGREQSPGGSPHMSRTSSSPHHHPYLQPTHSPRKDAHSPMYAGEVPGGGNYARSSMPIPCSSPAQASSASPKGSHSPGTFSPKLPSGPMLAPSSGSGSELGRIYPYPHPHHSVAPTIHLSPAFYAAAAAAAAGHSLPYPLFGAPYPHSHSAAAASVYLDTFHSALSHRGGESLQQQQQQQQQRSRSPSPSRGQQGQGGYHANRLYPTTSVTSLHSKLIESPIVSERNAYHGHHNHHHIPPGQFSPQSGKTIGLSKGGPLGISGGILNLGPPRTGGGSSHKNVSQQPENLTLNKPISHPMQNGYFNGKPWMEHHQTLHHNDQLKRKHEAEMKDTRLKESGKHRIPMLSPPQEMSIMSKPGRSVSFTPEGYHTAHRGPGPHHYINGHHSNPLQSPGILTDSNHAKKAMQQITGNHQSTSQQSPQFLPPSPKKRAAQWNFAVPANPGSKIDLPPPPPPPHPQLSHHADQLKYLNVNQRPSNHSLPVPNSSMSTYLSGQSAQHSSSPSSSYPSSPRLPGSGPSTPKSPSVHQVKFSFSSGSSKENLYSGKGGGAKGSRNDSSSSSSSSDGNVPWPVEQMPILEAFKRGSLIKLANGDLRPVEDLKADDFVQAVASMPGTLKIIHCTVLSIQQGDGRNGSPACKVTMTVGSHLQNQQVVVPSTPEQPFFVLGRGWSSLSPKTTEKLLQLPCSPLAVGDVCITLSKTSRNPPQSGKQGSNQQVPKSPSTRGRKPGSGRGGGNGGIKRGLPQGPPPKSPLAAPPSQTGDNQSGIKVVVSEPQGQSMGPPPSLPPSPNKVVTATATNSGEPNEAEKEGPPSPKRRRWSAPEPEIPENESPSSKQLEASSSGPTPHGDGEPNSAKMDVNSNLEIKGNDSNPSQSSVGVDAQSTKA